MQWLSGNPSDTAISLERAASELPCGTYFSAQVRLSALRAMSAAARPDREWQTVNRDMDEAIVTAQADQRLPDLAICQLRRSQLLRQQGEQREAAACLQRATELFISLDMTGWLAEARTFREVLAA
jgi:hypothetical protein